MVASPNGRDGSVTIHSDALVYAGLIDAGESASSRSNPLVTRRYRSRAGKRRDLSGGDGAALSDVPELHIEGVDRAEILVFELA